MSTGVSEATGRVRVATRRALRAGSRVRLEDLLPLVLLLLFDLVVPPVDVLCQDGVIQDFGRSALADEGGF